MGLLAAACSGAAAGPTGGGEAKAAEGAAAGTDGKPEASTAGPSKAGPSEPGSRCQTQVEGADPDALTGTGLQAALEPLLRRCGLAERPGVVHLTVQFAIGAGGCVEQVSLRPEGGSPEAESCVRAAFDSLRFPPPGQGGVVLLRYPLTFGAASPAPRGS